MSLHYILIFVITATEMHLGSIQKVLQSRTEMVQLNKEIIQTTGRDLLKICDLWSFKSFFLEYDRMAST